MNIVTTCSNNACTGRLWIYFSDASREQQWGTINMRGGMDQYERDIVCRQLGYKGSHDSSQREPPLSDDSAPIWLTNVTCGGVNERGNELNLLECNHFNICDSSCSHDDDVVMNCSKFLCELILFERTQSIARYTRGQGVGVHMQNLGWVSSF